MWNELQRRLGADLARTIQERFGVEYEPVLQVPPRRELGDLSSPAAMQLAGMLRRKPRSIARELASALPRPEIVRDIRVQGAGFLNLFLDRRAFAAAMMDAALIDGVAPRGGKVVIEHTDINPSQAAHIGHLRNAVLGDVLGRSLKSLGYPVEIQNYVDDTGVQLADVVVGFLDLRRMTTAEAAAVPEPFDFYCWDLHNEVCRWYEDEPAARKHRHETLHELEIGRGERAEMGRLVARRIVSRHLATLRRIDVSYDLLTRESDVLGHQFFEQAFGRLKESGAVRLEKEGKNAGCWVMPLPRSEELAGVYDLDTVIVRADGTVTYIGTDLAYQLWKFGRLGRDFGYHFWSGEGVWETTREGVEGHPRFGGAWRVFNVVDVRQSWLQKIVRAGLQALGYEAEANRSIHFAYERVSLSPATSRQLGFLEADAGDQLLEMSGSKGIGVKADGLMDQLELKAREEVAKRNRDLGQPELDDLARQIAVAALRFFMVKATNNRIIAFDFDEALSFEGESGPYLQYSLVRAMNIRRRLQQEGLAADVFAEEVAGIPHELWSEDLWDLILGVARTGEMVEKATETLELSLIARHALEIAQRFNALYHRHPILQEKDPRIRASRLATVQIFRRGLETLSELLGVPVPEKM
jgi:arginyl-tRNA synthetase